MSSKRWGYTAAIALLLAACVGADGPLVSTTTTTTLPDFLAPTATTTSTTFASTTTTVPFVPDTEDFVGTIDILRFTCHESAGATIQFAAKWRWPGSVHGDLSYEIHGLRDGVVNISTVEIRGVIAQSQQHTIGVGTCDLDELGVTLVPRLFRPAEDDQ